MAEEWTEGQGRQRGGEAQAVEVLQREWADHQRRLERVGREREREREGRRHGDSGGAEGRPPLLPFRQSAIPPEQESEMQGRACRQIWGEATKLAKRNRKVAAQGRSVREEEEAVA